MPADAGRQSLAGPRGERELRSFLIAEIVSPYDFTTLETMVAPYDDNVVVLARNYATRIHPGDYTFMMGDGASATALD